jgi:hypothetical protein
MRFDASNRLFIILIDINNFEESWKLKRNTKLLTSKIVEYLDNFSKEKPIIKYKKGEIICVQNPLDSTMKLCKRVIYLEGEEVTLRNGNVIQVPNNHIWVEGDNKENSLDSRRFGPISKHLVVGRVPCLIWPNFKYL